MPDVAFDKLAQDEYNPICFTRKANAMRITHETIAKQAGVSRLVVSQVLNKSRRARISEGKRQEILAISQRLNYQPRNITTHAIGYVLNLNDLSNESEVQILREMQVALSARAYRLVIAEFNPERPEEFRQAINAKTVDGVIYSRWYDGQLVSLVPPEIPVVVSAEADNIGVEIDQVLIDSRQSSRLITQHLIDHDHRWITLVTGQSNIRFHQHIKKGFFDAFEKADIPLTQAQLIEVSEASDIAPLLHKQLNSNHPPTAIIGLEFVRVASIINQLQTAMYRVPEDISVVSIYDSPHYNWLSPSITSTSAGGKVTAPRVVERLLEKIENSICAPEKRVISARLMERASVDSPRTF